MSGILLRGEGGGFQEGILQDIPVVWAGKCPASPVPQDGVKGHNMKGNYLTGKPRPLGRGASQIKFLKPEHPVHLIPSA
jgi:hypothetical protein